MFVRVINFAESFVGLIDLIFRGLKELNIHSFHTIEQIKYFQTNTCKCMEEVVYI